MEQFDWDAELWQLLETEQQKDQDHTLPESEAYGKMSLKEERAEILEAFYDHAMTVSSLEENELNVEYIVHAKPRDNLEAIADEVNELLQSDLERRAELLSGEVEVRGIFPYFPEPDTDEYEAHDQVLLEGESLRGTIAGYRVAPMWSHGTFIANEQLSDDDATVREKRPDQKELGICMMLQNASVIEPGGVEIATYETLLVPFSYPVVEIDKIIRHATKKSSESKAPSEPLNLLMHLKGYIFLDLSNDIENDLNFNEYTPQEIYQKHFEAQSQLKAFMGSVDLNEVLVVSAELATSFDGEILQLEEREVFYDQATVVKEGAFWRVVHGFTVIDYEGTKRNKPVHILPENLKTIRRKTE